MQRGLVEFLAVLGSVDGFTEVDQWPFVYTMECPALSPRRTWNSAE